MTKLTEVKGISVQILNQELRAAAVDFYNKTVADKSVRIVATSLSQRDKIKESGENLRLLIELTSKDIKE